MWQFQGVRRLAVEELGKCDIDPVTKLELCARFHIDHDWASEAIDALSRRPDVLSLDEASRAGLHLTMMISETREQLAQEALIKSRRAFSKLEETLKSTVDEKNRKAEVLKRTKGELRVVELRLQKALEELDLTVELAGGKRRINALKRQAEAAPEQSQKHM
jgi:hypothetical protein